MGVQSSSVRGAAAEIAIGDDIFDIVHARVLRRFPDLVEQMGGRPEQLFARVGIDPETVSEGAVATYRQMVDLMDYAARQLDCVDFGLRLAKLQSQDGMFGPLGSVMLNSQTFGDALRYVSEHSYAHSLAAEIWLKRLADEEAVFVGHDILLDQQSNRAQAIEQILLDGHLAALAMTGGCARARRVHFRHHAISAARVYRRYFGCEVRFGQNEDGVVFSDRDLACPILTADPSAHQSAVRFVEATFTRHRPPVHAEIRRLIMRHLADGNASNDRIASELSLHPRTLQRQLAAEGTSFRQVKDEVRADLIRYFIQQTDLDFSKISERLGFAEQSVLTRFCRKSFAMSPSQLRRARTAPECRNR